MAKTHFQDLDNTITCGSSSTKVSTYIQDVNCKTCLRLAPKTEEEEDDNVHFRTGETTTACGSSNIGQSTPRAHKVTCPGCIT